MIGPYSAFRYRGSTPGADTNAYVLFDTTTVTGRALMEVTGYHRLRCDIAGTQAGTFNLYKSRDKGTTWRLVTATPATPSATASAIYDDVVEPYYDYKLEWANGGSAQAYFEADLAILPDRNSAVGGPFVPPAANNVQDNLNSGGGGANADITDDLGGGGTITDP